MTGHGQKGSHPLARTLTETWMEYLCIHIHAISSLIMIHIVLSFIQTIQSCLPIHRVEYIYAPQKGQQHASLECIHNEMHMLTKKLTRLKNKLKFEMTLFLSLACLSLCLSVHPSPAPHQYLRCLHVNTCRCKELLCGLWEKPHPVLSPSFYELVTFLSRSISLSLSRSLSLPLCLAPSFSPPLSLSLSLYLSLSLWCFMFCCVSWSYSHTLF